MEFVISLKEFEQILLNVTWKRMSEALAARQISKQSLLAALRPDLVLMTKSLNRYETVRALDDLHIPSYATDPHTVDDIISSTARLAEVLGIGEAGQALAQELRQRLTEIEGRVGELPRRRVLFVVWSDPLISVGRNTFIADALRRARAISVIDTAQDWPQVSLEEVVHLQPEALIFAATHPQAEARDFAALAQRPGWRDLEAVRKSRFVVITDAVNRPAPRLACRWRSSLDTPALDRVGDNEGPPALGQGPSRRRRS